MEPAFVSVEEAARFLGVARSTVYDLIHRDEFPVAYCRLGNRIVVNRQSLLNLAAAS